MLLVVGVGQCGVQVASHLLSSLGRSVPLLLVDTEPKALDAVAVHCGPLTYSIVTSQSGAGNNWAAGYHLHGPSARPNVLDTVNTLIEKHAISAVLVVYSLAGGTGSGLGSSIVECLRDEIGASVAILCQVVWPHRTGEVAVQAYNMVLALAHCQLHADETQFGEMPFIPDGSGEIDPSELKAAMQSLGYDVKNQMVYQVLESLVSDGKRLINFDTFLDLMTAKMSSKDSREDIIKVFRLFDDDGSGKISLENLRRVARELGRRSTFTNGLNRRRHGNTSSERPFDSMHGTSSFGPDLVLGPPDTPPDEETPVFGPAQHVPLA